MEVKQWVSDQLISLLGYTQPIVAQYVIRLSKEASSTDDIVERLADVGLSSTTETWSFSEELFAKVPHKASLRVNLCQEQERELAIPARKQKTYAVLDDDDDGGDVRINDSEKRNFRKKRIDNEHNVDDGCNGRRVKRRVREEDGSDSEEEIMRDRREREELEQNIRKRDEAKTKKLTEPNKLKPKKEQEANQRVDGLQHFDNIEALRKISRQEYLKNRERKKLEELRDDIEDEQYLSEGVKLTEARIAH